MSLRLLIEPGGEKYLSFAKDKLAQLKGNMKKLGFKALAKHFRLSNSTRIWIESHEVRPGIYLDWIRIEGGCKDRPGFLLSRVGGADYFAHYNDGFVEQIDPITGTPRPEPDPATLTKGVKVPDQLIPGATTGTPASKFSGSMREVVGCYHSAGKDAPFSFNWGTTHGITKISFLNSDGNLVTRTYLVEISSLGVFAVRVKATGKCCDSWDISDYLPTVEELKANPGWSIYTTPVSLFWAKTLGLREKVQLLIDGPTMFAVYGLGSPWTTEHGWAFSASGTAIRAVTARAESSPEDHYSCNQWEISISAAGPEAEPVASLVQLDNEAPFTPLLENEVWIPDTIAWTGIAAFPAGGNEVAQFPTQDAPIHVYYDGELAVVTRWSLVKETVPAFITPGPPVWDLIRLVNAGPVTVFTCQPLFVGQTSYTDNTEGGVGLNTPAYTRYTAGYYSGKQSHIFQRYNITGALRATTTAQFFQTVVNSITNSYPLDPSCYFIRDVPPPTEIHSCTSTFDRTTVAHQAFLDRDTYNEARDGKVSVVLFAQEREAILFVWEQTFSEDGTRKNGFQQIKSYQFTVAEAKTDTGDCPFTNIIHTPGFTILDSGQIFAPFNSNFASDTIEGGAQLDLGNASYTAIATFGVGPAYVWDNYNLGTFLDFDITTKPTAESNVFAMHGNMARIVPKLAPPDQISNAVYLLDNALIVVGGFAAPSEVLGFVGRA